MEVNEKNEIDSNYFRIDYKNQNYEISNIYKKWLEKKRLNNNNGEEIKCEKDNIVLFTSNNEKSIICPICNSKYYKCLSCGRVSNTELSECCFKANFKKLIKNEKIYKYTVNDLNDDDIINFIFLIILFFFIPTMIGIAVGLYSFYFFFFDLKNKRNEKYYDAFYKKEGFLCFLRNFSMIICIFLTSVVYTILFYFIFILFFLVSMPFKLYPVKIFVGIFETIY